MLRVLLGVACAAGAAGSAGCYTHECDAQTTHYGGGDLISTGNGYAYETNPLSGRWVDFPGQATVVVTYPKPVSDVLANCTKVFATDAWIGTADAPNEDDGAVFTQSAGQTAQFHAVDTRGFTVVNGTCSPYSARFVISYVCPPASPEAGTGDAGGADATVE